MYIETSYPRKKGDKAKLEIPVSGNAVLACLKFFYHMYGDAMGSLTVFSGSAVVLNVSGNQGNYWIQADISIHLRNAVSFNDHGALFVIEFYSNMFSILVE